MVVFSVVLLEGVIAFLFKRGPLKKSLGNPGYTLHCLLNKFFLEPEDFFSDDTKAKTGKFKKVILNSFKQKVHGITLD